MFPTKLEAMQCGGGALKDLFFMRYRAKFALETFSCLAALSKFILSFFPAELEENVIVLHVAY